MVLLDIKIIRRVQCAVAKKLIGRAVKGIGAGFGCGVYNPTGGAAVGCGELLVNTENSEMASTPILPPNTLPGPPFDASLMFIPSRR